MRIDDRTIVASCTIASVAFAWWFFRAFPTSRVDFDLVYEAARAVLRGDNPYDVVGPGKEWHFPWGLLYPMPAIVAVSPLALLPVLPARLIFVGAGAAAFSFGVLRSGYRWRLLAFGSVAMMSSVSSAQWSALMAAVALWPTLGWLIVVKPNLALAMLAGTKPRDVPMLAFLLAAVLVIVSFALLPSWLSSWRSTFVDFSHGSSPILRPGGILLLLALLRWKREDARILLALAVIPQTPAVYDGVLFFLFARTRLECALIALLTYVAHELWHSTISGDDLNAHLVAYGRIVVWTLYLPALILVLRRANESDMRRPASVAAA